MPEIGSDIRTYADARADILDGDVAIWHGRAHKPLHLGIQDFSASRFIHSAIFGWLGDGWAAQQLLLLAEFTQKKGGVLTLASSQIRGESGCWSVFRPRFLFQDHRRAAFLNMVNLTGRAYCNRSIWSNLLRSLPVLRWFFGRRADENDATTWGAETCSASVCQSLRLVGFDPDSGDSWSDPVPHKSDYLVTPTDLVRSRFFDYRFTLSWEDS